MKDLFIVNSNRSLDAYISHVRNMFETSEIKYFGFKEPTIGIGRSLTQNALLHVWLREYAAHILKCAQKDVSESEIEGLKTIMKQQYYTHTGYDHMVYTEINPFNGDKKIKLRSTRDYSVGELFHFMEWLQSKAAESGLMLEVKGEHAQLKAETIA